MWPPALIELKDDLAIPDEDTEDDAALQRRLGAAVRFVQRIRKDAFLTSDDGTLIEPAEYSLAGSMEAETLELGTLMLAGRLFARRRSADALLFMAETGTTRVPFTDEDLNRLLRIGRHGRRRAVG
ncbi:MAG: hypothetical protein ACRD0W_22020 [Acidimicrobiales bacterium]